uniref:DUF6215 domain-containing protein n=1 Tax=Streptomyces sp. NBC_00049 TaxID=2903617 RepID=A0AAU2JYA1_9ACTN
MTESAVAPKKSINAAVQALAAVLAVGGLGGAVWVMQKIEQHRYGDRGPAVCSGTSDADLPAGYVSGAELCTALNRPDLPALLGTPEESALNAGGSVSWFTSAGGAKIGTPVAKVQLETYSVKLAASYDRLPVADMADYLGATVQKTTFLGRPAVLSSDRTIAITFGAGQTGSGPGGIARHLIVAKDAQDGGGSFEVVIWRQDGRLPEDAALLRTAEQVLPTVPGWAAEVSAGSGGPGV